MDCKVTVCRTWGEITAAFNALKVAKLGFDSEGDVQRRAWLFRGHRTASYVLEPSIEREAHGKRISWVALESEMLSEFTVKARLHMSHVQLPPPEEKLSWLAIMQHYGIPTRLLDFTFSPYVALYFALRGRERFCAAAPEVWAFDQVALDEAASKLSRKADRETTGPTRGKKVSLDPKDFATDKDVLRQESLRREKILSNALTPSNHHRYFFNKRGLVASALPPVENQRLSSQQGAFLFSGAEKLTFEQSLSQMMSTYKGEWCKRFQLTWEVLAEAEERLFQMNIHDLSLFPDVEGLAGFIRQKARLLWG